MNCEHHTLNPKTDNELICTPCSPKTPREQPANNSNEPMPSTGLHHPGEELFTAFPSNISAGEEVCVFRNQKKRAEIKKAAQNRRPWLLRKKLPLKTFVGQRPFSP
jgi:hypothetical protein